MKHAFLQVDVFASRPYFGNAVAVILDADALDGEQMQRIARWTNLSETTFVMRPTRPGADYRARIFTPTHELPFAGHPTLGTCHAWLSSREERGAAAPDDVIVQECGAGLVELRRIDGRLDFAGPPLIRSGPIVEAPVDHVAR